MAAKLQVPHGEWERWLIETFPDRTAKTWRLYMRLAKHREEVRAAGAGNLNEAHRLLAGKPSRRADEETRAKALELRAGGMTLQAVADEVGVSHNAVAGWCNPKQEELRRERQHRQSKTAQRRATAHARAQEMSEAGGPLDDAFRKARVATQSLREALDERDRSPESKAAARLAITKLAGVEDQILRAARAAA